MLLEFVALLLSGSTSISAISESASWQFLNNLKTLGVSGPFDEYVIRSTIAVTSVFKCLRHLITKPVLGFQAHDGKPVGSFDRSRCQCGVVLEDNVATSAQSPRIK